MYKKLLFVLLIINSLSLFSQSLEADIYKYIDKFTSNKDDTSLKELSEAELIFSSNVKSDKEQLALVILQCNKAFYLKNKNRIILSIEEYENAYSRFTKYNLNHYNIIEYCLKPLGNLYTITKDYNSAENTIISYIEIANKEGNIHLEISGYINLSVIYNNIGNSKLAIDMLYKALSFNEDINDIQKELILNNLFSNYISQKDLKNAKIINDMLFGNIIFYRNKSVLLSMQNQHILALSTFEILKDLRSKEEYFSIRDLANTLYNEAILNVKISDIRNAKSKLLEALTILNPDILDIKNIRTSNLYAENTFIEIFDLLGSISVNLDDKLQYYDYSFYVEHLLEQQTTAQESKQINQITSRRRSEKCIEILFEKYSSSNDESNLVKAFQYSDRTKSVVLREMEFYNSLLIKHPNDKNLILVEKLKNKQEQLTSIIVKSSYLTKKNTDISEIRKNINKINVELKKVEKIINTKYGGRLENLRIKNLQNKLLEKNATIVEFFYGERYIYKYSLDKNSIKLSLLSTDIETKIKEYIHLFDNNYTINDNVSAFKKEAYNLFNLLELDKNINSENIIIIPDGLLNFIPFETLLTKDTSTNLYSKMPFIIKEHSICYSYSALQFLKNNTKISSINTLVFAPIFYGSNRELSYSKVEAEQIKEKIKATILIDKEANKVNFINKSKDFSIIHLSTHASGGTFYNPANIEFSDNVMLVNELYELSMNNNLIVLSACETGIGKLLKGEGAISIARGFNYAGIKNALFSLWQINDKSTSKIMSKFYENLHKTKSVFISSRESKLKYLSDTKIKNIKKSPYYWGAFVYYGNIDINEKDSFSFSKLFSLLMLFILILDSTLRN